MNEKIVREGERRMGKKGKHLGKEKEKREIGREGIERKRRTQEKQENRKNSGEREGRM